MFIDTHCHFDFPPFSDNLADAVDRSLQAKIAGIIVPSVSADRFDPILQLSSRYRLIYPALGLHPIYSHTEQDLQKLIAILNNQPNKLIAIGEIGLDRYILNQINEAEANWQQQQALFRAQLQLAKQFELPVLIHSRQTHDVIQRELQQANLPCRGVIHGFSGSYEQAMQFVKLGFYIGVGGVISYERANKTRKAIAKLPLDCLLLETDAPDMPLYGHQGQANRPENIVQIFNQLTKLRSEPSPQILSTIFTNTLRLFSRINRRDTS